MKAENMQITIHFRKNKSLKGIILMEKQQEKVFLKIKVPQLKFEILFCS